MILDTKLYPPVPPEYVVHRPYLNNKLTKAFDAGRHVAVIAGAGYGKSTLMASWLIDSNIQPAWFSIDEMDNNPHRFFRYLAGSIGNRYQVNIESVELILKSTSIPDFSVVLETIYDLLNSIDERVVLVIDDFHHIDNKDILSGVDFLLKHVSSAITIILISRIDPNISLSKLRLNQKITEIRESDLRFTKGEIVELIHPVINDDMISYEFAEVLLMKTEGWAVGLSLGLLAYKQEKSGTEFIKRFSGSHFYVADYLMDEVLGQLSMEQEEMLMISSLFHRFNQHLISSISSHDGSSLFRELRKSGFFLISLDDDDRWYRLHHLVQDLLKKRAYSHFDASRIKSLYHQSGQWFEREHYFEEALECYHLSGSYTDLIRIISTKALPLLASGDLKTVSDWLDMVPDHLKLSTLDLCVIEGWIASINQQIDRNEYISEIADSILSQSHTSYIEDIEAHLALLKANHLIQKKGVKQSDVEKLLQKAESNAGDSNLLLHSIIQLYRGNIFRMTGELDSALLAYRKTLHYAGQIENYSLILPTTTAVGEIGILKGNFDEARATLEVTLYTIYQKFTLVRIPKVGLLHVLLALIYYEKNELDEAENQLNQAEDISNRTNDYNALVICYDVKARLHILYGNISEAREYLNKATKLSEKRQLMYYSAYLVHLTFIIRKKIGNRIAIEQCLDLIDKHSNWYGFWLGQLELTRIKTLFELGRYKEAKDEALQLKRESISRSATFVELHATIWLSMISYKLTESEDSHEKLNQALELAERMDVARPILDTGPDVLLILKNYTVDKKYDGAVSIGFIQKIFKEFEKQQKLTPTGLSEPLSERELEVLRLIAAGLSNKEIGEQLFLAEGTVKKHSFTIYQKLGTKNRLQAVQKSKNMGLI